MKNLLVSWLLVTAPLWAAEFWINNETGSDESAGTQKAPFATFDRAAKELVPGITIHFVPTDTPYPIDVRIEKNGTPDDRIVVDGHGAVCSGMTRLFSKDWKNEGGGLFSRPLPNNAWPMRTKWDGGFELVRLNGEPAERSASLEALVPMQYFLYKNQKEHKTDPLHNMLYIKLPEGQTPDDLIVESIVGLGGIYVGGDYVTVRNFITEYGGRDGFATFRGKGIVFENIEARYFMDQGMSHHGAEVTIRNAHFHHNAGGGVVDVYPECKTRYENCLIEYDTYRGGVEFYSGQFEMENCVIRGNMKKAFTVTKNAQVKIKNCLIIAENPKAERTGVSIGSESASLEMIGCTVQGFPEGVNASLMTGTRLSMTDCRFIDCQTVFRLTAKKPEVDFSKQLSASGVTCSDALWTVTTPFDGGWKTDKLTDPAALAEKTGLSLSVEPIAPISVPELTVGPAD